MELCLTKLLIEFIALVVPLKNLNEHLRTDGKYKTLYKYTYPHGNEDYRKLEILRKIVKGTVRKAIIDFQPKNDPPRFLLMGEYACLLFAIFKTIFYLSQLR